MAETAHTGMKPASVRARLRAALKTRTAVRQAIVLAEILAPPTALRAPRARARQFSRRAPRPPDVEQ
jgi:hypothetical protein